MMIYPEVTKEAGVPSGLLFTAQLQAVKLKICRKQCSSEMVVFGVCKCCL